MTENAIAKEIVDAAFRIHTTLGPGLLESVYHARSRRFEVEDLARSLVRPALPMLSSDSARLKSMKYPVSLIATEEGYSVSCPGLPRMLVAGRYGRGGTGEHSRCHTRIPRSGKATGRRAEFEGSGSFGLADAEDSTNRSPSGRQSLGEGGVPGCQARQACRHDRRQENCDYSQARPGRRVYDGRNCPGCRAHRAAVPRTALAGIYGAHVAYIDGRRH